MRTVFRSVRIFDGSGVSPHDSVLVEDGVITQVGGVTADAPDVVDGTGKTLLPGFVDAHTHVFGSVENLELALAFGVTTEVDLFSFPPDATSALLASSRSRDDVAQMITAGMLACPPGSRPALMLPGLLPTVDGPSHAAAFVAARAAEGSACIKVHLDDGANHGMSVPLFDLPTLRALGSAARDVGLPTVAHVSDARTMELAFAAGLDMATHVPLDSSLSEEVVRAAAARGQAVIPTLAIAELAVDTARGRSLVDDPRIAALLPPDAESALREGTEGLAVEELPPGSSMEKVLTSMRRLRSAGVEVLVGTDANNAPFRACPAVHGAAIHRELELFVASGHTPAEALAAATSLPAKRFGLHDRGSVAEGLRADLLLVDGDPTRDIFATRAITGVWKRGVRRSQPA
ncbi:amidohydrolase family protein [Allokutzneria multivorans]|uniref:Amidohydrolase family protein n=1 Tax=Allokutzneria multivorans TaxID=1142134 RepID=A0ABP7QZB2_9PSEU